MSDSISEDKWGELARNLGAEVREEPKESSAESEVVGKSRIPAPRVPSMPPKRPSSGWDQLGSEFGLPAPPEEPRKPGAETSEALEEPRGEKPSKPSRPRKSEQKAERDRGGPKREESSRRPDRTEGSRGGEERRRPRVAEPSEREKRPTRPERTGEVVEPQPQSTPPVRPKPEPPPVAPPRSGYGLPDWFPFARKRDTPPPPPAASEPPAPAYEETPVEEEDYDVETSESLEGAEERQPERGAEEDESRKGKRRRPRRRRRGGKTKDESVEKPRTKSTAPVESIVVDLGPAGHDVELFEDEEEDNSFAENDHDEGSDDEDSGSARPASHRNIPSWGEAIGVVVDANLATRSERKKSARPPGNGQGGRPRGRRKKRS